MPDYIIRQRDRGRWLIEHGFMSAPTQYRLYGRRFLQVWWPNQQCQSTEGGWLVIQIEARPRPNVWGRGQSFEAEAKSLRPRLRPKFWPWGHIGLEDLTSLTLSYLWGGCRQEIGDIQLTDHCASPIWTIELENRNKKAQIKIIISNGDYNMSYNRSMQMLHCRDTPIHQWIYPDFGTTHTTYLHT